ncbi:M48 family metallopeptidase [Vulcaniibacterium tengchongense]|uniref:Peptidase M48-like protein n=1 Tax=Vulcaniibacterium tengchongense TaxID=1273429 RepID=A0A3N4VG57_9GAMM|nr:M48 family metallopeptidase [Vulcaniibacterium tengchongense]RPE82056.1 peptidase M48-like protein [Vulcaniibacterium tengchongense]
MRVDPFGGARRQGRRGFGGVRWWILILFAGYAAWTWFGSAQVDPYTGEKAHYGASADEEVQLGAQAFQQVLGDAGAQGALLPADAQASREVREIAQRLIARVPQVTAELAAQHGQQAPGDYRNFQWDVAVIRSEQANAFCLPGGKMAVYTGLFPVARTRDALAVVMGHEIAHALLRHGSQRMAQQKLVQLGQLAGAMATSGMDPQQQQMVMAALGAGAQYGFVLPYGRNHETQADRVGLMLAAAACYDPREAIPLWQRMSQTGGGQRPPEFASTHPDPANRIQALQALMPQAQQFYAKYCAERPPLQ